MTCGLHVPSSGLNAPGILIEAMSSQAFLPVSALLRELGDQVRTVPGMRPFTLAGCAMRHGGNVNRSRCSCCQMSSPHGRSCHMTQGDLQLPQPAAAAASRLLWCRHDSRSTDCI